MKNLTLIVFAAWLMFAAFSTKQDSNRECWNKGYISGWCYAQNRNMPCMKPSTIPNPPYLPYNRNTCNDYKDAGFLKGVKDYGNL